MVLVHFCTIFILLSSIRSHRMSELLIDKNVIAYVYVYNIYNSSVTISMPSK